VTKSDREFALKYSTKLNHKGQPDIRNYRSLQILPFDLARERRWPNYWDGVTMCKHGHIASRPVSNPAICNDCVHVVANESPVYPMASNSDLTAPPDGHQVFIDPIANKKFEWTTENENQFLSALTNSGDVTRALAAIQAQPEHFFDHRDDNPVFRSRYEVIMNGRVKELREWKTANAALEGNDRLAGAMFAPIRSKDDLGGRGARTPEMIRARNAALVSRHIGPDRCSVGNRAGVEAKDTPVLVKGPDDASGGDGGVAGSAGRGGAAPEDDPNRDLVS
jgi:hypothetical protein